MKIKVEQCTKLIKKPGMPQARSCFREKGHRGRHSPDLTGLKNAYGYTEFLRRGPDYIDKKTGYHHTVWIARHKFGVLAKVSAISLFNGHSKGIHYPKNSLNASKSPEYKTLYNHRRWIFNENHRSHKNYSEMKFYDGWNPDKGGNLFIGVKWLRENRPKPGPN